MQYQIVFDYDGTLHNSADIYKPSFLKAYDYLVKNGHAEDKRFQEEEITKWLGISAKDMWNSFMPHLPAEEMDHCRQMIGSNMVREIEAGNARLYDGVHELLEILRDQGHWLVFLSNCSSKYMASHIKAFGLDRYFNEFHCTEEHGYQSKVHIYGKCLKDWEGPTVVVGDRSVDMDVAKAYDLISVGCEYGFGHEDELEHATMKAASLEEVKAHLMALSSVVL